MPTEKQVLVFLEIEHGALHPLAAEALEAGRQVALGLKGELTAVIMGGTISSEATQGVRHYGVERIYAVEHPLLAVYQGEYFCRSLSEVCRMASPAMIILANTLIGSDLAPRLAWTEEAGLITDCVAIEAANGAIEFTKPVYSGNVMAVYSPITTPTLITIRPRAFTPQPSSELSRAEIVQVAAALDEITVRTTVVERIEEAGDGIKLGSAQRIVAGGRGIGKAEGFTLLKTMADTLGAAIGASRPPCDLGWVSAKAQVGQTGEIVAPGLYIAVGISGSTQHLAGMAASKTIVAINKDPQANIFKIADYGVVGNYEDVIPVFTETLREILA